MPKSEHLILSEGYDVEYYELEYMMYKSMSRKSVITIAVIKNRFCCLFLLLSNRNLRFDKLINQTLICS